MSGYEPSYRRYVGEVHRQGDDPDSWRMVFSGDDEIEAAKAAHRSSRSSGRPGDRWRTREIVSRTISTGTRDQPPIRTTEKTNAEDE